jgi:thioredoxin 1
MNNTIINGTDSTFKREVLESSIPVLVDFWAPWCGPCRIVAPVIEELATEYDGKFKVVKVNTDEHGQVAAQYGVMSIPTLAIFRDGKLVDAVIGAVPKKMLKEKMEEHMAKVVN